MPDGRGGPAAVRHRAGPDRRPGPVGHRGQQDHRGDHGTVPVVVHLQRVGGDAQQHGDHRHGRRGGGRGRGAVAPRERGTASADGDGLAEAEAPGRALQVGIEQVDDAAGRDRPGMAEKVEVAGPHERQVGERPRADPEGPDRRGAGRSRPGEHAGHPEDRPRCDGHAQGEAGDGGAAAVLPGQHHRGDPAERDQDLDRMAVPRGAGREPEQQHRTDEQVAAQSGHPAGRHACANREGGEQQAGVAESQQPGRRAARIAAGEQRAAGQQLQRAGLVPVAGVDEAEPAVEDVPAGRGEGRHVRRRRARDPAGRGRQRGQHQSQAQGGGAERERHAGAPASATGTARPVAASAGWRGAVRSNTTAASSSSSART